jgi:hypothetical protein
MLPVIAMVDEGPDRQSAVKNRQSSHRSSRARIRFR